MCCRFNNLKVLSDVTFYGKYEICTKGCVIKHILIIALVHIVAQVCLTKYVNFRCNHTKSRCSISRNRVFKENKLRVQFLQVILSRVPKGTHTNRSQAHTRARTHTALQSLGGLTSHLSYRCHRNFRLSCLATQSCRHSSPHLVPT